jgi:hypothetical protein
METRIIVVFTEHSHLLDIFTFIIAVDGLTLRYVLVNYTLKHLNIRRLLRVT